MGRTGRAVLIGFALLLAAAPSALAAGGKLNAEIRRDQHGIPHIKAEDFKGLAFGYGYAFASDNLCTIADSYVTVRAERSRYFGPDAGYQQRGNSFPANNLNSDFFYKRIIDNRTVEQMLEQPPPQGPVDEIKEGVTGYVAGYNKYLADTGVANLPDPRCRGAEWVSQPIREMDVYRRFYQLALLASGTIAIDGIASAQPPLPDSRAQTGAQPRFNPDAKAADLGEALEDFPAGGIGSNGVGLGSEATDNGSGMVLANPHFPWDGPERFYQTHLTIPGELNVSGGSLYGVPLVLIGHTDNLAWTHTVSTGYRFTPFQEILNPTDPTQYLYDGQFRDMTRDRVTVKVQTPNGLEDRSRTLYSTHHGPVFTSLAGVPLPWLPVAAFTMGDANASNFRYLNHFFETNQAQSTEELDAILKRNQGIPWVNTIAADSGGRAYYADISVVPNVTDEKATLCNTPVGIATSALLRLPILNGALSACEWDNDSDAIQEGIFGPSHLPSHFRDDYTSNMNDSHWLSNPEAPIEGYDRIIGDERTPRALRTRLGLRIIQERLDGSDGLPGSRFTRQQLQDAVFNNRQYAGELWRDQLVTLCNTAPLGFLLGSSGPVNVSEACPVLAGWDRHDNLDSNGAILFRRFASRALSSSPLPIGLPLPTGDLTVFATPFNAADPVNTPSGLNILSPKVQLALADAVTDLRAAGIPLNAPLRGWQYERRGDEKIPIHGGPGTVGVFNAINVPWVGFNPNDPNRPMGYPDVPHGSSFVMVTQFEPGGEGCPDDRSILTYSQSENPNSPYRSNQTRMFSNKEWVDPAFCEAEVLAEPGLQTTALEGCLPEGCGDDDPGPGPGPGPGAGGGSPFTPQSGAGAALDPRAKAKRRCKRVRSKPKRKRCYRRLRKRARS